MSEKLKQEFSIEYERDLEDSIGEIYWSVTNNNSMIIVQYPMQFGRPPRNISNSCSATLFASEWWFN